MQLEGQYQIRCAVIAISAAEGSQYGRSTVVLVNGWRSLGPDHPYMQQQKAHLQRGSQSYRHGWRRSSFNSSCSKGKLDKSFCLGNTKWRESTTCQAQFLYCAVTKGNGLWKHSGLQTILIQVLVLSVALLPYSVPNECQYAMARTEDRSKGADDGGDASKGWPGTKQQRVSGTAKHILSWLSRTQYPALWFAMSFARISTKVSDRKRRCYQPLAQTQLGMTGSAQEKERLAAIKGRVLRIERERAVGVTRRRQTRRETPRESKRLPGQPTSIMLWDLSSITSAEYTKIKTTVRKLGTEQCVQVRSASYPQLPGCHCHVPPHHSLKKMKNRRETRARRARRRRTPPRSSTLGRAHAAHPNGRRTGFYGFGRIPLMRPWTAAHHLDDALPLQLTTFALCATHLEPPVYHFALARAEPPQACRIRPGTVRYRQCAAKLLVCIGVPRALRWKRHGGDDWAWGTGPESSLVDRSSRVAPRPSSCDNRHCASPPSASV
ncbi:uncharacterized protein TRIVIDRAFT_63914 [Trichoderma virens Gv29-8]|uniref:Uncharacterized protein n=1 Tax=Hypocrea virens (strain Gv29-8 / FGSC 10586) TaxID=413071 RepID=G9MP62_HYPVG|nr:uncharacterized protein TRIVIDRAFT_63914 [Trichoderma virens Gv29-8]EHK23664.1 hypothetical protein TRIVIDRAFT_63914 [Trichoderma virens Gv29-8]UKZ49961.1 hypothetical protein TrVGV298_004216 [Trichoderma virens]